MRRSPALLLMALPIAAALMAACGTAVPGAAPSASRPPSAQSPSAQSPSAQSPSVPAQALAPGTTGPQVLLLQQRLAALKYYPGPADGRFGPDTLEAVWAFQEVQGLAPGR